MKIGDLVRVIGLASGLEDDPDGLPTKTVFERSVGRTFPVVGFDECGYVELEVGAVIGVESYLHSIWIEPEHLEVVEESN
jgi:hypothetical protein